MGCPGGLVTVVLAVALPLLAVERMVELQLRFVAGSIHRGRDSAVYGYRLVVGSKAESVEEEVGCSERVVVGVANGEQDLSSGWGYELFEEQA